MVAFSGPLFEVAECVAPALSAQGGLEHCQERLRKFLCFSNKGKAQLQIRPHRSFRELQPAQVIPSAPARTRQRASAQPCAVDGARTKPDERGAGGTRGGFVQIRPRYLYKALSFSKFRRYYFWAIFDEFRGAAAIFARGLQMPRLPRQPAAAAAAVPASSPSSSPSSASSSSSLSPHCLRHRRQRGAARHRRSRRAPLRRVPPAHDVASRIGQLFY